MKYPKHIKLTKEEQQIEDEIEQFVPLSKAEMKKFTAAVERARKTANISIRLSVDDLDRIKHIAKKDGLPYQTLIGSIIHKYSTNQLIDQQTVKQIVTTALQQN